MSGGLELAEVLSEKPIRILRIIARLNIGGPAIQTITLSGELSGNTFQTLLVCGRISPGEGDMTYLAEDKGVQPLVIPDLGREISFFADLKTLFILKKIILRFKPHIIHTHTAKGGFLGRVAALSVNITRPSKTRIKIVHTFHGHTFHSYFGKVKTFVFILIERLLARFTDKIIVISRRQKEDICRNYRIADRKRTEIIPLGFDLSSFRDCNRYRQNTRKQYLSCESREVFLVGTIGRLTPVKNLHLLLKAVGRLKDLGKIALFRFLVVGDGELREELLNESMALGIEDAVMFTGWQREMIPVYSALDAVVLTSENEGTPVALIEAMAAGIPVIATDVGGVPDLIGKTETIIEDGGRVSERGILIGSGNTGELVNALLFLQKNKNADSRMIARARDFVDRIYSMDRLVSDIESLYMELVPRINSSSP